MRPLIFNILNNIGISWYLRRRKKDYLTVLSLHRITEERDYFFKPITPINFINLLEYITKKYTVINFDILEENKTYSKPPLILSFDDGYSDFLEFTLPIMKKFGLTANLNLVNNCLNGEMTIWTQELNEIFNYLKNNKITNNNIINTNIKNLDECNNNWFFYYKNFYNYLSKIKYNLRNKILENLKFQYAINSQIKMLNWNDAIKILKEGIEIGSHSYRHDSLNTLDMEEEMQFEILNSILEMKDKLKKNITILALPNGLYNESVILYVKKIGIKNVLLVKNDVTPLKILSSDFNIIDRIGMTNDNQAEMILRTELFHSHFRGNK